MDSFIKFMAHVDQIDQPVAEEIILLGRARAVLHGADRIAGFWDRINKIR